MPRCASLTQGEEPSAAGMRFVHSASVMTVESVMTTRLWVELLLPGSLPGSRGEKRGGVTSLRCGVDLAAAAD